MFKKKPYVIYSREYSKCKGIFKCFITPFYSNSNLSRDKYFLFCKMSLIWGLVWYNMLLCSPDSVEIIIFHKHIMLEAVCWLELWYVNYAVVVGSFGMTGHSSVEIKKKKIK